jgi:hypothetical protein
MCPAVSVKLVTVRLRDQRSRGEERSIAVHIHREQPIHRPSEAYPLSGSIRKWDPEHRLVLALIACFHHAHLHMSRFQPFRCTVTRVIRSMSMTTESNPPINLVTVNTFPDRAKTVVGRVLDNVKGRYNIVHAGNAESESRRGLWPTWPSSKKLTVRH